MGQQIPKKVKVKANSDARAAANVVLKGLFYKAYAEGEVVWSYSRENRPEGVKAFNALQNYRKKLNRSPLRHAEELAIVKQVRLSAKDEGIRYTISLHRVHIEVAENTQAILNLLDNEQIGPIDLNLPAQGEKVD